MKIQRALIAGAAAMLMAGCAGYGVGVYGPVYYGPGPAADIEYDGYYDGYYGPLYDGYWNNDAFYYRTSAGDRFRKADAVHVRHDAAPGFNHVHGTAHAATGGDHADHRPS